MSTLGTDLIADVAAARYAREDDQDRRVRLGLDLLQVGMLYTAGPLAFSVVEHAPQRKPRLKLKLYPAHFVHTMALLNPIEAKA